MLEGHKKVNELGGVSEMNGETVNERRGDVIDGEDIGYCFGDVFRVLCNAGLCLLDSGFV